MTLGDELKSLLSDAAVTIHPSPTATSIHYDIDEGYNTALTLCRDGRQHTVLSERESVTSVPNDKPVFAGSASPESRFKEALRSMDMNWTQPEPRTLSTQTAYDLADDGERHDFSQFVNTLARELQPRIQPHTLTAARIKEYAPPGEDTTSSKIYGVRFNH